MKKTKVSYLVVLYNADDASSLIQDNAFGFITPKGKLMFEGNEIGELGNQEAIEWATKNSNAEMNITPPIADVKVVFSLKGTFGAGTKTIMECTKVVDKSEGIVKPQKATVKRTVSLKFRGSSTVCEGRSGFLKELNTGKTPTVTFTREKATNEAVMLYGTKGNKIVGRAALSEDTRKVKWDALTNQSVKRMDLIDSVIEVDIEIEEAVELDYSNIIAIAKNIGMPEDQARKRIDIMENRYYMSQEEIEFVAKGWKEVTNPAGLEFIPDIDKVHYVDGDDRKLYYLLGYYAENPDKNLRLVGIQSTGKNTLIEQLASLMWRPLLQISCSRESSREDFEGAVTLGHKVYKHDREMLEKQLLTGEFTSFQTASMKAKILELSTENIIQTLEFMKEPLVIGALEGWWVLLDEINLASSSVTSRFHSLLDYRREITVPKLGTVKAAEGFAVISTMNPNSFAGTSNMNQAFETRFRTMFLGARDNITDILKSQCPQATEDDVTILNTLYTSIQDNVNNEKISDAFLSVRNFIDVLNIKGFAPLKQRVLHNIAYISVNEPESNKIVEDLIDNLFA